MEAARGLAIATREGARLLPVHKAAGPRGASVRLAGQAARVRGPMCRLQNNPLAGGRARELNVAAWSMDGRGHGTDIGMTKAAP